MSILVNGRVFDGERVHGDANLRIANGRVVELFSGPVDDSEQALDLEGRLLAPGLIDLQVNGGGGVLFNEAPTVDTLRTIAAAHRRFGTTGLLPTLISDAPETMSRAVDAVGEAIASGVPGVLGIHLEGPFLDPAARGIHAERHLRPLRDDDLGVRSFSILSLMGFGAALVATPLGSYDTHRRIRRCSLWEHTVLFAVSHLRSDRPHPLSLSRDAARCETATESSRHVDRKQLPGRARLASRSRIQRSRLRARAGARSA